MDYWIGKGMPPEKIALGMAGYGRSFKLDNPNNHGLNAPTTGGGLLAYYEICKMPLTVVKNNAAGAPYGYSGDLWVGFDTPESLANDKVGLVKQKGTSYINSFLVEGGVITGGRGTKKS